MRMDQIVERPGKTIFASPEPIEQALGLDGAGKPRGKRQRWPWLVLLALAAGGAVAYWQLAGASEPGTVYRTAPIERGRLTVEVSATGTLQPLTQVDVSSELSGVVRSVAVEQNQRVANGDVLAELDTTRIVAQIERAEANVSAARARIVDAEITLGETQPTLRS